jgi:ADP-ribosyl-[dinitrogen reductase] hydrolase
VLEAGRPAFASNYRPSSNSEHNVMSNEPSLSGQQDRAIGALLGLAVGDAVGTTLEFTMRDADAPLTDMIGGGPFNLEPGEWTDDTAMALALADSLLQGGDVDEADLVARFADWYRNGTYSCTGTCFDIGITTRSALELWETTRRTDCGPTDAHTAGNGSLMRLSPVAIRFWNHPLDLDDAAARQSRVTHGAAEAVDACVAYARMLAAAIAARSRDEVLQPSADHELAEGVSRVLAGSWRAKKRHDIRSGGYVIHSLEAALWCISQTMDYRSAVLLAANLGDDADTTAAITGQLAGALYGASGIPAEWLERLAWGERIEGTAKALFAASLTGSSSQRFNWNEGDVIPLMDDEMIDPSAFEIDYSGVPDEEDVWGPENNDVRRGT